jgi:hypothetical protein
MRGDVTCDERFCSHSPILGYLFYLSWDLQFPQLTLLLVCCALVLDKTFTVFFLSSDMEGGEILAASLYTDDKFSYMCVKQSL